MAQAERDRDRLVAAAAAYLDHREKYGHLPATDEPNPTFNEFMVALIRVCPDGWSDTGKLARLIVFVGGAAMSTSGEGRSTTREGDDDAAV